MFKLQPKLDFRRDVEAHVLGKEAAVCGVKDYCGALDILIINIERDGGILYSWKGSTGTTRVGKYDSATKQNKLLYSFDKPVCVSSCSLNKEETLLAVSLARNNSGEEPLKPMSKCLTLLIEIHPINNTKVLKAVDCRVKVQFLHPGTDHRSVLESHLLLLTEDGYVDQYHVLMTRHGGYKVLMANPERLSKTAERLAEDLCWVQWDVHTQRLYYLTHVDKFLLRCVQFYDNRNCETVLELPLELHAHPFTTIKFVNLGFDHFYVERPERVQMEVFTNRIGSMCVCYSRPSCDKPELIYTVVLVHKDCSKTFRITLGDTTRRHPLFIPIGYYMVVYLHACFLHCINTRQQEMLCHSLFLSGNNADLGLPAKSGRLTVMHAEEEESSPALLDLSSGTIYSVQINPAYLMQILRSDPPFSSMADAQRLAALHCLLLHKGSDPNVELEIIEWLCDNATLESFDQIQEFILASLYRINYKMSLGLDKLLPCSSVFDKKDVPACLTEVPGVLCTAEPLAHPVFQGKARSLQGFWSELQWNTERTTFFHADPNPRYRTSHAQADWTKLVTARPSGHMTHLLDNTKKVLSTVDNWRHDGKLVPLFQEEDHHQRVLIGLTVEKLREHLNTHLPRLGKKKIDVLVVNYVAKLLELIRHMLETVWLKHSLGPRVLCLTQPAGPGEWAVFHFMLRILQATRGLCAPLPPGYHTLLAAFAVRCLPRHTFLQYVDHGFLRLTETFVSRLMTDFDNSDANEKLKFSVLKRLPEANRFYHMWDHPVSSASICRDYVRNVLGRRDRNKGFAFTGRDKAGFRPEFLPLTHLAKVLSDVEEQALNPFDEQENVDATFVGETALKQTLILLGFEGK
ncbi:gamma-secretase-activating protein isoform X1 [Entelurus aequoreus]|uniref:gamma-secretase-activating protein isoform X1 n=1 Tax=Entelurus aequoreus TaxID=161455 RepID=UPI002B1CE3D6|nr:gamma-secretase-activating protein isoform X1 [Entelurus aequoreus]XP_061922566.1 gamma-secretase-activating protein isoform X1 [Entelurus aequoreus]